MSRKVIQLAPMPIYGGNDFIYALCDDGTIWSRIVPGGKWTHIGEPPSSPNPEGAQT